MNGAAAVLAVTVFFATMVLVVEPGARRAAERAAAGAGLDPRTVRLGLGYCLKGRWAYWADDSHGRRGKVCAGGWLPARVTLPNTARRNAR